MLKEPLTTRRHCTRYVLLTVVFAVFISIFAIVMATPKAFAERQGTGEHRGEEPTVTLAGGREVVSEDLIVNYKRGTSEHMQNVVRKRLSTVLGEDYPEINTEVVELEKPATNARNLAAKKAQIEANPAVESVEYNQVYKVAWVPNDPLLRRGKQRNLRAVRAPKAWDRSRGGVRVAVLDSGCYRKHVELNERKIIRQTDVYYGNRLANDELGHGTHVSSILAADTNNRRGIAGGAPSAKILCAKVTSNTGKSSTRAQLAGLR